MPVQGKGAFAQQQFNRYTVSNGQGWGWFGLVCGPSWVGQVLQGLVSLCLYGIAVSLGTGCDPRDQWKGMGGLGYVRCNEDLSPGQSFWGGLREFSHAFFFTVVHNERRANFTPTDFSLHNPLPPVLEGGTDNYRIK